LLATVPRLNNIFNAGRAGKTFSDEEQNLASLLGDESGSMQ
jgi:hypothetical protein